MILNDVSRSPQSDHYSQPEYSQATSANGPISSSTLSGCHLIELKSFSDNFNVGGKVLFSE